MAASKQFALARYNENGSLDTTFAGDGKVKTDLSSSTDEVANGIAIDSKGRIVVAGYATVDGGQRFAVARYKTNGSLDTSFAGNGKLTTDFTSSTNEGATGVAIDANDRIVVGGFANVIGTGATPRFALARYEEDGSLDASFSDDGKLITDFTGNISEAISALAIDSQGRIVVAGYASVLDATGSASLFALARYQENGDLDNTFAGNGKLTTDFPANTLGEDSARANAMAIDSQGRIVAAGYTGGSFGQKVALARYQENGDLDGAFAGNGKLTIEFDGASSYSSVRAVAIDSKGRIVVAGSAVVYIAGGASTHFGLARFKANGDLDHTFAGNGKLTTNFASTDGESVQAAVIDANGRIVVTGWAHADGVGYRLALARYKENGDLDTTFSNDGKLLTDFTGSSNEEAKAIAIDASGRIVVAGHAEE